MFSSSCVVHARGRLTAPIYLFFFAFRRVYMYIHTSTFYSTRVYAENIRVQHNTALRV